MKSKGFHHVILSNRDELFNVMCFLFHDNTFQTKIDPRADYPSQDPNQSIVLGIFDIFSNRDNH